MTIKAIAAKEGYNNSSIAEAEYVIEIIAPVTFSRIASHNLITTTDTYMIVDVNSGRALSSANGSNSAPAAVSVTISDNTITGVISDELKWKFEATADGYIIHPANNEDTWLYSTNANNGVRVGTNANSTWTLDIAHDTVPNYHGMKHNGTNRYIGVYNNQDWRGYTTIGTNIENTQIEFFVLGDAPVQVATPTFTPAAGTYTTAQNVAIACETEGASIYYTV
ncbi:MAG: chitobiase/beta-hexosaminidase C-terminal domain-containing protein, partial [Bacteroidales bacterium]|nr:chitobiase/beta-hexosaminidase C-terminal domain-containing protein [Bacteroidales bacterium]